MNKTKNKGDKKSITDPERTNKTKRTRLKTTQTDENAGSNKKKRQKMETDRHTDQTEGQRD